VTMQTYDSSGAGARFFKKILDCFESHRRGERAAVLLRSLTITKAEAGEKISIALKNIIGRTEGKEPNGVRGILLVFQIEEVGV